MLALVEARRLDAVPADLARATSFLRQAQERLDQLPLLTSVTVRYGDAYALPYAAPLGGSSEQLGRAVGQAAIAFEVKICRQVVER